MAIATASEFKTYAGISGTTYDARLAVILPGVQAEMERVCNREFDFDDSQSDYLDGTDSPQIVIRNVPLISISAIRLVDADGGTLYTYDDSDYNHDTGNTNDTGVITLVSARDGWVTDTSGSLPVWDRQATRPCFPRGRRNILVLYSAGYGGTIAMPADLKMLFYDLVSIRLAQGAKDPTLKSESLGNYSYTNGDKNLVLGWQQLLVEKCAPWIRMGVSA